MGMLLRRYYDETYANPVEDKNKGVAVEAVAPKVESTQETIKTEAEPEEVKDADTVVLENLNLVELRKLGKEHGIPKAHLKGKAELCELLKELV